MSNFYNRVKMIVSAIVFVTLDSIYLNFIKDYFSKQIELIQKTPIKINFIATLLSYLFLIFSINYCLLSKQLFLKEQPICYKGFNDFNAHAGKFYGQSVDAVRVVIP
jgi:hypothetical protein